ncbi:MAG: MmcQ/YjbR family DNA-binding protein [Chloroflexi bacterium]|nr:MAG: MmcQ/YjbR family DNA-binding protein [Chloroflexota bacterium]
MTTRSSSGSNPTCARCPPHRVAVSELSRAVQGLRRVALGYPEAVEDFPWGDRTIKVRGKIFLFLGQDKETLNLTVKLPESADAALGLPFTSPTRYRLGRSGWVSARFPKNSEIPLDMFRDWIDESYRAVAPSSLVRKLAPPPPPP